MMSNQHDDQELQRYLDGLSEVSRAYARLPHEAPGPALDERILAAARREAARPHRPAWMVPTALAATLMLALSLSWQQLRSPTSPLRDGYTPEQPAPAGVARRTGNGNDSPLREDDAIGTVASDTPPRAQRAPSAGAISPAASDGARPESLHTVASPAAADDVQVAAADEAAVSARPDDASFDFAPAPPKVTGATTTPGLAESVRRDPTPVAEEVAPHDPATAAAAPARAAQTETAKAGRAASAPALQRRGEDERSALEESAQSPGMDPATTAATSAAGYPNGWATAPDAGYYPAAPDADESAATAARRATPVPPADARGALASRASDALAVDADDAQRQKTPGDTALTNRATEDAPVREQVEASRRAFASTADQAESPPQPSAGLAAKAAQPDPLSGYRLGEPPPAPGNVATAELTESTRANPQKFLAAIRARHDRGAVDEARRLLGEFRERYPHYPLPEDFPLAEPTSTPPRD